MGTRGKTNAEKTQRKMHGCGKTEYDWPWIDIRGSFDGEVWGKLVLGEGKPLYRGKGLG